MPLIHFRYIGEVGSLLLLLPSRRTSAGALSVVELWGFAYCRSVTCFPA
jgi:hypothetical protein